MKKLISFITLSLFVISTTVSAQTAMPQSAIPAAGMNSKVGVAAGVKGSVQLARNGGVGTVVSSGAEIFLGDKISTDSKVGVQILLLDQTTFTIGANSAIVVDQFIYDPATDAGKVSMRVVEGTFRFITGKIAHKNPENMQVDLPNATIGVRGTMVMGSVNGTHSLAILTGPGDKNNTGSRHGAIIVGGKGDDATKFVSIAKTGFGTEIDGNGAPKMPFLVPQNILNNITMELSPPKDDEKSGEKKDSSGSEQPGSGGSATERAGQARVDTGGHVFNFEHLPPPSTFLPLDVPTQLNCKPGDLCKTFSDGERRITRVQELAFVNTGIAHFEALNFPFYNTAGAPTGGLFSIEYDIKFGQGSVGGGNSKVIGQNANINSGIQFQVSLPPRPFGTADSLATYNYSASNFSGCTTCSANINLTLFNNNGIIAENAQAVVNVADAAGPAISVHGSATAPRINGSLS